MTSDSSRSNGTSFLHAGREAVVRFYGAGFGGQFLFVVPEHNLIGVLNSWNVFDNPSGNILVAFRDTCWRQHAANAFGTAVRAAGFA